MGLDYYKILKVDRNVNDEDLKKSYKKLAMKWHPDKNLSNNEDSEARFKQIVEAYEVLRDPLKRTVYDQYGEEGLNGAAAPPPAPGGISFFSAGYGPTTFRVNPQNADDKFAEFFGKTMQVEEILTINMRTGWKKGMKITFAGKGDEQPKVTPVDLIFIIDEKQHNVFTLDDNDLIVAQKITLVDALYGITLILLPWMTGI
ncbi:DnaJ-like protein subfamily B member 6 [Hibiscus syriacus]|uniref:DnaJ-like protein subfamily B member 6 n=1 Tax=Hibiscus syriacus TaxID=106335 RepID=A0A6A2YHS0_HIBSY|nr:DnaJ-like protein subfamily B member 6 [Hibiscus syriacus]